jgi:hypothetical protein
MSRWGPTDIQHNNALAPLLLAISLIVLVASLEAMSLMHTTSPWYELLHLASQFVSLCFTAGITGLFSPKSPLRYAGIAVILAQVLTLQRALRDSAFLQSYALVKLLMRANLWTSTLYALVNVILDPIDWSDSHVFPSTVSRLASAAACNGRWRAINTAREAKNVPPFTRTPARGSLMVRYTAIAVVSYAVLDLMGSSSNPEDAIGEATLEKQQMWRRFGQMTVEEAAFRAASTAGLWVGTYVLVNAIYSSFAVLALAMGSDPSVWRPIFGPASEMYSVRNFWGYVHSFLRLFHHSPCTASCLDGEGS